VVAEEEARELERWVRRDGDGVRFVARSRPTISLELVAALRRGEVVAVQGDRALGARSVPTPVAISERANSISGELNRTLGRPTTTHEQQVQIASELFVAQRSALKGLVETDVPAIEKELERLGAPYTPGRIPRM